MADIFFSYAREDQSRILPLVHLIEHNDWSVFWDTSILGGEYFRNRIDQELQEARCIVVAWSFHSITSNWVIEEAQVGLDRGILVPLMIDNIAPPLGFRSVNAIQFHGCQPAEHETACKMLIDSLRDSIGVSTDISSNNATSHTPRKTTKKLSLREWISSVHGISIATLFIVGSVILFFITDHQSDDLPPGNNTTYAIQNNAKEIKYYKKTGDGPSVQSTLKNNGFGYKLVILPPAQEKFRNSDTKTNTIYCGQATEDVNAVKQIARMLVDSGVALKQVGGVPLNAAWRNVPSNSNDIYVATVGTNDNHQPLTREEINKLSSCDPDENISVDDR
ncbi:MAG: toll/interleukin-1 receptor domain-containing protein [Alphaproteobacteria bacterium]